jgi:hypothetical protein
MTPAELIAKIAADLHVTAEIATTGAQLVDDIEAELQTVREWLTSDTQRETNGICTSLAYGQYDLGTRMIISGGEVVEIDSHLESQYDEQTEDPF